LPINRAGRERRATTAPRTILGRALGTFFTFQFVLVAWVFFRAENFRAARALFGEMATLTTYHPNLDPRVLAVLGFGLGMHFLPQSLESWARQRFVALPGIAQGIALFALLLVVRRMASAEAVPFVYFQF
jgi:alginate O-acetyltransferase complex protein AlgI